MGKSRRATKREETSQQGKFEIKQLVPKNSEQKNYINLIKNRVVTVAIGKPGTGKTFVPSAMAGNYLMQNFSVFEKLILVRPNVSLGPSLGALPGTLEEKMKPWLVPIAEGVKWAIGEKNFSSQIERGNIEVTAIEHARGRTWNNCFVIIDEAQNISQEAMICLMTRIGKDCRVIICGDVEQQDIKHNSGLSMLVSMNEKYSNLPYSVLELEENVRSRESDEFYNLFKLENLI